METHAGEGSSIPDHEYLQAGADIASDRRRSLATRPIWSSRSRNRSPPNTRFFRPGLILFTYLHLAPLPELTDRLLEAKVNGVAYETIREADGSLPLLTPMSEVAGRMAVQVGAQYLERPNGGRGILLGGVPGVAPANVVILGGGVVGTNAAKMAAGHGRARHHHRPQSRPPARARRHLQQPGRHAGLQRLDHCARPCSPPTW